MPIKGPKGNVHFHDTRKQWTLSIIGVILAAGGLVFAMLWPNIFDKIMAKEMALRPNSRVYDAWKNPPLTMNLDIYLFNWTNPESIKDPTIKPIVEQIGPYRFIDKPDKVNIVWNPENYTVSFKRKNVYYYDEENSKGKLDDLITSVNMVALSAGAKARTWGFFRQKAVSVGLDMYSQQISITKFASELLFDGFQEDMIDAAKEFPIFGSDVHVPFDRAGWFYPRNGSEDLTGFYNMYTGQDDIKKIGKMHTWNYKTHTGFFNSHCGMVNGSAGELYPPKLQKNSTISFFNPDLCRSLTFDYEGTFEIEGLQGYKFSGGPKSVDNGTLYAENECFCAGECVPSGVMNITACRFGAPVFMSYPHFFEADPFYVNQVEGMKPSKDKHQFYMIFEPTTGIALEVAARMQINLLIRPIANVNLYKNVSTVFIPILWFEQKVSISQEMASELRMALNIIITGQICAGVIFTIGLIMIFWFPIDQCIRKNRANKNNVNQRTKNEKQKYNDGIGHDNTETDNKLKPEGSPLLLKTNNKFSKVQFIGTNDTNSNDTKEIILPSFSSTTEKTQKL